MTQEDSQKESQEKVHNPHDKFFKETFSDVAVAKDFLTHCTPYNLSEFVDLDTLRLEKDSYTDKQMKEYFSDLLFSVKINGKMGYIYFLFEHKSDIDQNVSLQLLRYMCNIWDTYRKDKRNKNKKLPTIIPLVIYQGKRKWHAKHCFSETLENYDTLPNWAQACIPDFQYILYPTASYKKDELKDCIKLNIMFTLSYDVLTKQGNDLLESIFYSLDTLEKLDNQQMATEYLETFLRYVFSVGKNLDDDNFEQVKQRLETNYSEGSGSIMTWAEMFMDRGEQKQAVKTLIMLLTKKFGILPSEMQEKIRTLDITMLEIITEEILQFKSLDDVQKYLK